jgi:hypothetical protein
MAGTETNEVRAHGTSQTISRLSAGFGLSLSRYKTRHPEPLFSQTLVVSVAAHLFGLTVMSDAPTCLYQNQTNCAPATLYGVVFSMVASRPEWGIPTSYRRTIVT